MEYKNSVRDDGRSSNAGDLGLSFVEIALENTGAQEMMTTEGIMVCICMRPKRGFQV